MKEGKFEKKEAYGMRKRELEGGKKVDEKEMKGIG
jgi:hypothetical protein